MTISANQPYFLPYIGFWQLIFASDLFLLEDDYNYIKSGWIARNKILINDAPYNFSLHLSQASSNKLISEISLVECQDSRKRLLKQVYLSYHRAPCFKDGYQLFEQIMNCDILNLASFIEYSINIVCRYFGISTIIRRSSEFNTYGRLKKTERIFEYCKILNANQYLNLIGGMSLYSKQEFEEHGIDLKFLKSDIPRYKQFSDEFIPSLSILDAIMFCSKDQLQKMLGCYTLI